MGLDRPIDITADQQKTLLALLKRHLPNTTAWVYGSRVKWTSRPQSDLDLVVFTTPDQDRRVSELREAFEESNLPFRVDLFVWDAVPEQFRKQIEAEHVVLVGEKESRMVGKRRYIPASEFCASVRDGTHDSPKPVERGRKLVTSRHLTTGQLDISDAYLISEEYFEHINRRSKVDKWDVLISMIGTVGESCLIKEEPDFAIKNIGLFKTRSEADGKWLYYYLRTKTAQKSIKEQSRGTTQQYIPLEALRDFPILVADDPAEQRAIAHVLGTLDDKIELNRRMNETLEAMARALFKSWFIDFDPVRAKMAGRDPGLPQDLADLFPDRLVDSELGPIPEGWEVKTIEDLAEVSSGKRPGVRYAETSDLAQVPLWGGNGPMGFVPEPLVEYPILLTGRVGTLGSIFRITSPCWPSDNTLILTVKDKRAFEFLFFQLKRIDFTSLNVGSTQPLVTQTNLKTQLLCFPPANVLERFHTFAEISYARLDESNSESRFLAALRDVLLPKLIAGEIRVRDAETFLEQVR